MSPEFIIPHGANVRCIRDYYLYGTLTIKTGWIGKVIARRVTSGAAGYLVKWKGKLGPVHVTIEHLEQVD